MYSILLYDKFKNSKYDNLIIPFIDYNSLCSNIRVLIFFLIYSMSYIDFKLLYPKSK